MTPPSPFQQLLGESFAALPPPLRLVHGLRAPLRAEGRADVTAATGLLARLLSWGAGLPKTGRDIPIAVTFTPGGDGEHWDRSFGTRRYASTLRRSRGHDDGLLVEYFGPFRMRFGLRVVPEGLRWTLAGWRLWALPLPRWSAPRIHCLESADGERYTFDIDVTFPLIGWLIHYRGWLFPETAPTITPQRRSA